MLRRSLLLQRASFLYCIVLHVIHIASRFSRNTSPQVLRLSTTNEAARGQLLCVKLVYYIECSKVIELHCGGKMVAQLHMLREVDNLSRRSSTYVSPECEAFMDIPASSVYWDTETTKCVECFSVTGIIPRNIYSKFIM